MLESLHISNYALIDAITIEFQPGFNIITGETGAGKSIILGALSLLLGGRADMRSIRNDSSKSVIEAVFRVGDNASLRAFCLENDIEWDDKTLIMRRELSPSGRSRSFINDSPVNLTAMQQVGSRLVDIHSQHQNQLLAGEEFQMKIIDAIADNDQRLEAYSQLYNNFRKAMAAFKQTKAALMRDRDNADFMEFQIGQLEAVDLKEGEYAQLQADLETATEQTELRSYIEEAADALSEGKTNILSLLSRVDQACSEIESLLPEEDNIAARLEQVTVELTDISETIDSLRSGLASSSSVDDLDYIEHRLDAINTLMRKHNVDTPEQLIALRESLQSRLDNLADAENILNDLEAQARQARKKAMEAAREISDARKDAAEKFATLLTETAVPLGMSNLRCEIAVEKADMSATGIDTIEFRFAFNKNQQPTAIAGSASGGEISRLMLSIKSMVADMFSLPTIIFDEVDTGVSGDIASRMGRMMAHLAEGIQVITITHLPQVASRGSAHYKVFKEDDDHSTHTRIIRLDREGRIAELALMLSGNPNSEAARANAAALLGDADSEK
ncbi:MAG: DNA repair protein RecN [Barnesiella sp.]|nr:DNA repair protein RecN [Barnesiella sp.]